jgi:hypothetical protein
MIKYITGDITKSKFPDATLVYFPHVCNNINGFGSGVAYSISKRWSEVKQAYHDLYETDGLKLGTCQYVPIEGQNLIIINMIAQMGLISKSNPHPLQYSALENCMKLIKISIEKERLIKDNVEIHTVKFGSLRSGGSWDRIEAMINDIWRDISVTIYVFEN